MKPVDTSLRQKKNPWLQVSTIPNLKPSLSRNDCCGSWIDIFLFDIQFFWSAVVAPSQMDWSCRRKNSKVLNCNEKNSFETKKCIFLITSKLRRCWVWTRKRFLICSIVKKVFNVSKKSKLCLPTEVTWLSYWIKISQIVAVGHLGSLW